MAKASKGAKHITVGDVAYRWRAFGNDYGVDLTIWAAEGKGRVLVTCVAYDEGWASDGHGGHGRSRRQIIITTRLVCRIIELATTDGLWDPRRRGTPVILGGVDVSVDLGDAVRAPDRRTGITVA